MVGAGNQNTASGNQSFVGGGTSNTASGDQSVIGGGNFNTAAGSVSWAGGQNAYTKSVHSGAFVWGVGGAKSTTRGRPWTYFAVLTGFPNHGNCLSCEWRIRNPVSGLGASKFCGIVGRIKGLDLVLKRKQWTKPCVDKNKDMKLHLWILKPYDQLLSGIPSNITIYPVDTIDINVIDFITS